MRVIAGSARSIPLMTPDGDCTRPTTDRIKETLFNIIMDDIPGCNFLDLFYGSGQIGIEALSRGAASAAFIEKNKKVAELIGKNLKKTGLEEAATVIRGDVISNIPGLKAHPPFDIIYMDPPYDLKAEEQVIESIAEAGILSDGGMIIIEADLKRELKSIPGFRVYREKTYKTNKHIFLEAI